MGLQAILGTTRLAAPTVALQDQSVQSPVFFPTKPDSRALLADHDAALISAKN
jgi:hypothetical protein